MLRNILFFSISILLSSCFYPVIEGMMAYYDDAEKLDIYGILDGPGLFTDKYVLEYSINRKEQESISVTQKDSNYKQTWSGNLKVYVAQYCNVYIGGDVFPCRRHLRKAADVEIYIKPRSGGGRQLLAQKTVDIRDFHQSLLLTQVHFGSDKEQYKTRSRLNFDWDRAEPIVLDGTNDTIYHYTVWYWDKNNYKESNTIKDELLIEIPSSYKQ